MARRLYMAALAVVLGMSGAAFAQPANDECGSATVIGSLPFSDSLDVTSATTNPADPLLPCVFQLPIGDASVWYTYTATERTVLDVDTRASTYRTTVAVWGGGCGVFDRLACSDFELAPGTEEWGDQGHAFVTVDAGQTVHIEVASVFGPLGTLQLDVRHAVAGHPAPIGPEFVVNENETSYEQGRYIYAGTVDACRAANGDFVVAWQSCCGQDGDETGVFARRFAADGTPLGGELQVNTYTTLYQERPSIGCGSAGEFVVTWEDSSYGVKARLYDDTGSPVTTEIPVGAGDLPDVDMDAGGAFVVAFRDDFDVLVRRFDATGAPTMAATPLGADSASRPDISIVPTGEAVVVWEQYSSSAHARRLDASGSPTGSTIVVSEPPGIYVRDPAVSMNASQAFVVVWEDYYPSGFDIVGARTFSPTDVPGPIQTISEFQNFNVIDSDVALDDDGNFVVTWSDYFYTFDVFARRVRADGTKIGDADFEIPTVAAGTRAAAHVTDAVAGEFVVAWVGEDGEIDYPTDAYFAGSYGVRAQRFTFAPTVGPACPSTPAASCKQPVVAFKGKLKIKDKADDQGDALLWKWVNGDEVLLADLGDPLGDDGFALCLYDAGTLVTEALLPGGGTCDGKPCWKAVGNGFLYKDKLTSNGGVKKLLVKAADAGKAKMVVKAKGTNLQTPGLPLTLPAVAQLHGTSGTCWSAEFRPEGVQKNAPDAFGGQAQASP